MLRTSEGNVNNLSQLKQIINIDYQPHYNKIHFIIC